MLARGSSGSVHSDISCCECLDYVVAGARIEDRSIGRWMQLNSALVAALVPIQDDSIMSSHFAVPICPMLRAYEDSPGAWNI